MNHNKVLSVEEIPGLLRKYDSSRLLYNLACFYALANKLYDWPNDAKDRSRLFLAMSLAKDKKDGNLWKYVDTDPDLSEVRDDRLSQLKFHLSYEMADLDGELPAKDKEIADLFNKVFKDSGGIGSRVEDKQTPCKQINGTSFGQSQN